MKDLEREECARGTGIPVPEASPFDGSGLRISKH